MMSTLPERTSVLETKVENIENKLDELHDNLRDMNTGLQTQLKGMQEASTKQHAELGNKIKDLETIKNKWIWTVVGAITASGWIVANIDTISKFLK